MTEYQRRFLEDLDRRIAGTERELENLNAQRREFINRYNLNKPQQDGGN